MEMEFTVATKEKEKERWTNNNNQVTEEEERDREREVWRRVEDEDDACVDTTSLFPAFLFQFYAAFSALIKDAFAPRLVLFLIIFFLFSFLFASNK